MARRHASNVLLTGVVLSVVQAASSPIAATKSAQEMPGARRVREPNRTLASGMRATRRRGERYGEPCRLEVCAPWTGRWLYVMELADGVGHRMANILNCIALAFKHQVGFGGIVRRYSQRQTEQGVDFNQFLDSFFGAGAAEEMLFRDEDFQPGSMEYLKMKLHKPFSIRYLGDYNFASRAAELKPGEHTVMDGCSQHRGDGSLVDLFPEELHARVFAGLAQRRLGFAPGRRSVALHLRRGDLAKGEDRVTTDAFYFRLLDVLREVEPNADIHVWSATKAGEDGRGWTSDDFDGYRSRGFTVHLDDEDLMDPWAHMSRADVFVTSLSMFSYPPAVLNRGCIIYPGSVGYGDQPEVPPTWIDAHDIEGLRAISDYVPCEDGEYGEYLGQCGVAGLDQHSEEILLTDSPQALGRVEFRSSSNATVFKRKLQDCLRRLASPAT